MTPLLIALFALVLLIVLARVLSYETPKELAYEQALDRLNDSVTATKQAIGEQFVPAMIEAVKATNDLGEAFAKIEIDERTKMWALPDWPWPEVKTDQSSPKNPE